MYIIFSLKEARMLARTLGDKQLNCLSRQVLSIAMLKIPKIKCFIFLGHVAVPTEPIDLTQKRKKKFRKFLQKPCQNLGKDFESLGKGRYGT
jgi:hypothetical protein